MPRKKKKETINIKSSETKMFFGLVSFVLGIALIIAPFVGQQATLFVYISQFLGWPSLGWGIAITFLAINLLTKGKSCSKWSQFGGLVTLSLTLNTLFTFWLPREALENSLSLERAGGTLGRAIHLAINNTVGDILELVILLILLIVAFSLITGVKIEEITAYIQQMFGNIRVGDIKSKLGEKEGDEELVISGLEDEQLEIQDSNDLTDIPEEPSFTEAERSTHTESSSRTAPVGQEKLIPVDNTYESNPSEPKFPNWKYPKIDGLQDPEIKEQDRKVYKADALIIEQVLKNFGIPAKVVQIAVGPTVVRYALSLAVGVKVAKIKNLNNDIEVALKINKGMMRIEAPIPGTSYIGIEIPNKTPNFVYIKDMARKLISEADKYELPLILGKDIAGKTEIKDLVNIPHLLIAGATGTGKSVGLNSILTGILLTKTPDEVKFVMIDPKMVELTPYTGIPHLLTPVITDMELVVNALNWTIDEMMRRYRMLKQAQARKITEYNKKIGYTAMPYLVIVVDEMADLMLVAGPDVETKIQRLAQMGRAVGVHLILATQKPVVTVITGLIKSNIPGRIAYSVTSAMDSRVILDQTGAENLLGRGDMLYKDQTMPKSIRIQGTLISSEDIEDIMLQVKNQVTEDIEYSEDLTHAIEKPQNTHGKGSSGAREPEFPQALEIVIAEGKASASLLQRRLRVGYNKAARLIEELEDAGAIGPQEGAKPREVLVSSSSEILGETTQEL
jgi:DNA segregation ATPase FtsK/SpoIIIE, S-DNA-T family